MSDAKGDDLLSLISSILTRHDTSPERIPRSYRRMLERVMKLSTSDKVPVDVHIDISNLHWSMRDLNIVTVGYVLHQFN